MKVKTCCWIFVSPSVMLVIVGTARGQAVQCRPGGPWILSDDGNCKQAAKIVLDWDKAEHVRRGGGGMQLTRPLSHGTVYYKTLSRELQWSPPNLGMFIGCSSSLRVWWLTSTTLTLSTRHFYPLQCEWTLQTSHNIYPRPGWHNGANGNHTEHSALSHPAWDNWQWGDSLNGSLKWVLHGPPVLNFNLASRAQDDRGMWWRLSCACST